MKVAFVANLDAECELRTPSSYRPSSRMAAGIVARAAPLQRELAAALGVSIVVLVPGRPVPAGAGAAHGLCWSPTPRALALLGEASVPLPPAPPLAVLQAVNHRAFAAALPHRLPGARFVRSCAELAAARAQHDSPLGHLLKRPYGFAGRGRKHVPAGAPITGPLLTWVLASFAEHGRGLQVEPMVAVAADFALHGLVEPGGGTVLGTPTRQILDAAGSWQASAPAGHEISAAEGALLVEAARETAAALHAAGYFGPFGIDAYRYRNAGGRTAFHPLSEVNARMTMGWVLGMGAAAARLLATR